MEFLVVTDVSADQTIKYCLSKRCRPKHEHPKPSVSAASRLAQRKRLNIVYSSGVAQSASVQSRGKAQRRGDRMRHTAATGEEDICAR